MNAAPQQEVDPEVVQATMQALAMQRDAAMNEGVNLRAQLILTQRQLKQTEESLANAQAELTKLNEAAKVTGGA